MAYPCHQFVMSGSIEVNRAATEGRDPLAPALRQRGSIGRHYCLRIGGRRRYLRENPDRILKESSFGIGGPAHLFARHRVARQEARAAWLIEEPVASRGYQRLGASHIRDQLISSEDIRKLLHPVQNGVNRSSQQNDLAGARRSNGVGRNLVDRSKPKRGMRLFCVFIPPRDRASKTGSAQRQACRCSEQACAEDEDALNHACSYALVVAGALVYTLRPTAWAIRLSSPTSLANWSGNKVCAPSESALSGLGWTSTMIPSAPAATAARASAGTMSRRPVPCEGSPTMGKCES